MGSSSAGKSTHDVEHVMATCDGLGGEPAPRLRRIDAPEFAAAAASWAGKDRPPGDENGDAVARFEFETTCEVGLRETWRVAIPDVEGLTDEEIAERIDDELAAGKCEFVSEKKAEDEGDRELRRESVERL
jgi:hypothetical protein